jgi:membrane protease YdiL (CAAX protease family)
MILSCLGTGYLEESYFRYYLLIKLEIPVPNAAMRAALSTALFSLCHMYEGPWGILNAVIAGLFLSALFVRFRSLHGVALAHAFYNMFVYVMGNFSG